MLNRARLTNEQFASALAETSVVGVVIRTDLDGNLQAWRAGPCAELLGNIVYRELPRPRPAGFEDQRYAFYLEGYGWFRTPPEIFERVKKGGSRGEEKEQGQEQADAHAEVLNGGVRDGC